MELRDETRAEKSLRRWRLPAPPKCHKPNRGAGLNGILIKRKAWKIQTFFFPLEEIE